MTATELIARVQARIDLHGDLEVTMSTDAERFPGRVIPVEDIVLHENADHSYCFEITSCG